MQMMPLCWVELMTKQYKLWEIQKLKENFKASHSEKNKLLHKWMWFLFTNTGTQKTANNIYHYQKKRVAPQNPMCNNDVTFLTKWKKFTLYKQRKFIIHSIWEKYLKKDLANKKRTKRTPPKRESAEKRNQVTKVKLFTQFIIILLL